LTATNSNRSLSQECTAQRSTAQWTAINDDRLTLQIRNCSSSGRLIIQIKHSTRHSIERSHPIAAHSSDHRATTAEADHAAAHSLAAPPWPVAASRGGACRAQGNGWTLAERKPRMSSVAPWAGQLAVQSGSDRQAYDWPVEVARSDRQRCRDRHEIASPEAPPTPRSTACKQRAPWQLDHSTTAAHATWHRWHGFLRAERAISLDSHDPSDRKKATETSLA
jgi:hypothetical protein